MCPRPARSRRRRPVWPRLARNARAAAPQAAPVVSTSSTRRIVGRRDRRFAGLGTLRAWPARSVARARRACPSPRCVEAACGPADPAAAIARGQGLSLVVAPPPVPPPMQGDRHDPGVLRQPADRLTPRLDPEPAHPGGQPGVSLMLELQAHLSQRSLVRPQGRRRVEAQPRGHGTPHSPSASPRTDRPAGAQRGQTDAHAFAASSMNSLWHDVQNAPR